MPRYGIEFKDGTTTTIEADRPMSAFITAMALKPVRELWDIEDLERPNPLEGIHAASNAARRKESLSQPK